MNHITINKQLSQATVSQGEGTKETYTGDIFERTSSFTEAVNVIENNSHQALIEMTAKMYEHDVINKDVKVLLVYNDGLIYGEYHRGNITNIEMFPGKVNVAEERSVSWG